MTLDGPDVQPDALPTRRRAGRRGGRHRGGSFTLPPGSPTMVLAAAWPEVAGELARLIEASHPGVPVRVGGPADAHLTGTQLAGTSGQAAGQTTAVVVPVLTGPEQAAMAALHDGARDLPVLVAEPLGPHPLLAEALHLRLAEAGLARFDRTRLMSMVTSADGVILGVGQVDEAAEVTAVLLASRLAIPVVAASFGDAAMMMGAAVQLRDAGVHRLALSPCVIGMDPDGLGKIAAAVGAEHAAPLGAHPALAQLAVERYVEALEAAYIE